MWYCDTLCEHNSDQKRWDMEHSLVSNTNKYTRVSSNAYCNMACMSHTNANDEFEKENEIEKSGCHVRAILKFNKKTSKLYFVLSYFK